MKAFSSGYERILRLRQQQTRLAELQVMRDHATCTAIQNEISKIEQKIVSVNQECHKAASQQDLFTLLTCCTSYLNQLNSCLNQHAAELKIAERQLKNSLNHLKHTSDEKQLVDNLVTKQRQDFRSMQRHAEEIELFDLTQNRCSLETGL